ncbi:MAG: gliding motility-associated C-terminal domain-containing protein [Crocinitomicaceae bacterium]|nr:gliding motility-associated C-terminal domain-containing protein [Crocinitomicaceae bacterium]
MIKVLAFLYILIFTGVHVYSQYTTTGSASPMSGCNQFEITPNSTNQLGSMHANTQVDLTTNFSLLFEVKFGCDEFGGEGLAFVLQPGAWTLGNGDYELGYGGLTNTLAVEFDTRDNQASGQTTNWDIAGDHISLMQNGNINHNSADCLTGLPLDPISTFTGDVEDCAYHLVEISWTAGATQTIEVIVDGATSLIHTADMITNSLAGNTMVYWGWTGSTGVFSNQQVVNIALQPDFTISPTNCPGQVINFTANVQSHFPIVQYDWDFDGTPLINGGPTPSHTFLTGGSHPVTLTVTDSQGCTRDTVINVGVGFQVNVSADDTIICPNTSTVLHAEGLPYTGGSCCFELHCYDIWSDGWGGTEVEVFVDGVSAGTYAPPNLGGGSAHTEIFNFCWNINQNIQLVVNGTLGIQPQESSVFLIDQNNDTVAKIESDIISGSNTWFDGATDSYTVDCGVPPPAYTYQWNNTPLLSNDTDPDPIATVPSGTWFVVDVTDPGTGCTISDSVFVDSYTTGTAEISGSVTICQGDSADLTVTLSGPTPYDFTINGPGGPYVISGISSSPYLFSASLDGTYTITSFTSAGCTGTINPGTGDVTVIIPPVVDIEADATYCDGDPINALNVVSSNGGTVNWYDNPGLNPPVLATGNSYTPTPGVGVTTYYAAETESILGCEGPADAVTITVNQVPIAPLWTGQTTWCEDDIPTPATATPELGGTITWYDANPNPGPANVLSTANSYAPAMNVGTFSIWVTETANGCEGPASELVYTVKPTPNPPAVSGQTYYCEGEVATPLTATPNLGGQIDWYNSSMTNVGTGTTYTPSLSIGSSTYYAYETLNGCTSDSTEVIINVDAAPTVDVIGQVEICIGDSIQVTATNNGYDITWSLGQTGETVFLGPDTTTLVIVTATNPSCGSVDDSILVIVHPLPNIVAGNDTLIGIGGEVTLWATSPGTVNYSWSPQVDDCVESNCSVVYDVPDQATVYVVSATDQNGCQSTDSVFVDISGYMDVFVPNIFSPNGDGWNDVLEIKGPRLFNYRIEIYDRWGKRVFVSDEQKDYWDGTLNGNKLSPQTFVYMLSGETVLGEQIVLEGNVSIIE